MNMARDFPKESMDMLRYPHLASKAHAAEAPDASSPNSSSAMYPLVPDSFGFRRPIRAWDFLRLPNMNVRLMSLDAVAECVDAHNRLCNTSDNGANEPKPADTGSAAQEVVPSTESPATSRVYTCLEGTRVRKEVEGTTLAPAISPSSTRIDSRPNFLLTRRTALRAEVTRGHSGRRNEIQ